MEIKDPVVYLVDPGTEQDGYGNGGKVSTYGTEVELRYTRPKFSAAFGYSLYVVDQNTVAYWQSGDPRENLGLPADKFSASATWHVSDALSWNVNSTFTTEQRAYIYPHTEPVDMNSTFRLNSFVEYRWPHASIGLGVANLLDQNQYIAQPYAGGEAPMILTGREFYFKFGFQF